MSRIIFVTHPEVVIDPKVPVPDWPLSAVGRQRMERFAEDLMGREIVAIYSSDERKARDGAEILSRHLGAPHWIMAELGENDRSATGYLAPPEFWEVVEAFFARPRDSVRGWETAEAAQSRIVGAMDRVATETPASGDVVVVSHGGVGRLLMANLQEVEIGKEARPLHPGGGCWIEIERSGFRLAQSWRAIAD